MKKEQKKDIAYSLTKAGISSIPILGAAASELLQILVTPPIEKRRNDWMLEIGERIIKLENENKLKLEDLANNNIFIDVVLQTTQLAILTSEKEKIEFYKNVILNTAIGDCPNVTEIRIFLNYISTLSVWHIKLLKLFNNPEKYFIDNGLEIPEIEFPASFSKILETAFPELENKKDFTFLLCNDLSNHGLIRLTSGIYDVGYASLNALMTNSTAYYGAAFLKFIEKQ